MNEWMRKQGWWGEGKCVICRCEKCVCVCVGVWREAGGGPECYLAHIWVLCDPEGFFFLGAYNDLFKVFLLLLTGPPEVLGFVRRTAARLCLSSTAF